MDILEEILEAWAGLESRERLEWIVEMGSQLPALDAEYVADRNAGNHIIHECQAPVYLWPQVKDHRLFLVADVPREAPIARGFVALLYTAFHNQPESTLQQAPDDLLTWLEIRDLLGLQRQRGLHAIWQAVYKVKA